MIDLKKLKENPELFDSISPDEQTEEACLIAVKSSGHWLHKVKNQTLEIIKAALNENPFCLKFVITQTPQICLQAVKLNGLVLEYVKNQTEELCMIAVQENRAAIMCVKEQTPELCLEALSYGETATALPHIKICPNKDLKETVDLLTRMKKVKDNKKLISSTIRNMN